MNILRVGAHALLVECGDGALALAAEAMRRRATGEFLAVDVVPAAQTVLFDGVDDPIALAGRIPAWEIAPLAAVPSDTVELPVRFDGPDLADVAAAWAVAADAVAGIVCDVRLRAAFMGFAPGFAYLTGLGRATPRRSTPRTSVPAGAVGLAGEYAGIYPRSSPGGWQIIGTYVGEPLWDTDRAVPALLAPGTVVTFTEAP
jgi:KipI family sensor histidine kinase inhibitor